MENLYLTTTFSPMMLKSGMDAIVEEITLDEAIEILTARPLESAVGHEVTASVLSALTGIPVAFARVNIAIGHGDQVVCIIPAFRATEAREFSREEIVNAGYRCFLVSVEDGQ